MWQRLGDVIDEYWKIPAIERRKQHLTEIDVLAEKIGEYHLAHPFWYCEESRRLTDALFCSKSTDYS